MPDTVSLVEAVLWALPGWLAARLALRLPAERRRTWMVVAAACAVVVLDKVLDLQMLAVRHGKSLVHAIDDLVGDRRHRTVVRIAVLSVLAAAGTGALWWGVRGDRHRDGPKRLALLGLLGVLLFLGARLVPGLKERARSAVLAESVELACCGLVWCGVLLGRARGGD